MSEAKAKRAARERGPVMPTFLFVREPDVERDGGFALAGQLVFIRKDAKWSPDEQERRVMQIMIPVIDAAQSGRMPPSGQTWGWPGGTKPANTVDTNDEALMLEWMRERTAIKIRVPRDRPDWLDDDATRH